MCASWWKTTSQVKFAGGIDASCASLALPVKVITCPALKRASTTGVRIVAVGGVLVVTVSSAVALKSSPNAFVAAQRNSAPLSASGTLVRVSVLDVAPPMSTLLRCQR